MDEKEKKSNMYFKIHIITSKNAIDLLFKEQEPGILYIEKLHLIVSKYKKHIEDMKIEDLESDDD